MKQALNNIDINVIVNEIKPDIIDKHIKNFYQLDDNKFILTYRSEGPKQLLIDIPNRLHLSEFVYEKPRFPPKFCESIRKYLRGRKIIDFYQREHLDRVVIMDIAGKEGERWRMILEFFGKGNIILLKPDNTVLIARRYIKLKNEIVLPNKSYELPKQNFLDIFETPPDEFTKILLESDGSISKALSSGFNINKFIASELCAFSSIDANVNASDLTKIQVDELFSGIQAFKSKLEEKNYAPQVIYGPNDDDGFLSVEPLNFSKYTENKKKDYVSFNQAVDAFFSLNLSRDEVTKTPTGKKLSKNERILKAQLQQVEDLEIRVQENEDLGNLLYQHYLTLDKLLQTIYNARKKGFSWEDIIERIETGKENGLEEALLFHGFEPGKPIIYVEIEGNLIALDIRYSIIENIDKFFYSKSKKAKRKIPGALKTIERVTEKIEEEREKASQADDRKALQKKRKKKEWFEKFRWFYSSDGYLVIGGRDATSNETLYSKYLGENDLFFHSELPGAPVVIIKNKEDATIDEIPMQTLQEAAIFGVSYSRSWREGDTSANIYNVKPDQVSKTPKSGEFLPKGSFIITGERNYFRNVKLETSIGVKLVSGPITYQCLTERINNDEINELMEKEGETSEKLLNINPVIISGPFSAINDKASLVIKLKPSRDGMNSGQVASKLRKRFSYEINKDLKGITFPIDIEEIQRSLPPGKSSIVSDG
ncbi:MAG: ribosome rescue protein RqcH [Candidatus Hodarchaeota archaeon]